MHRQPIPSLAFLAPGLLHQLGNQLFAVQGSAQLLPDDAVNLRARILAAADRGSETLRVLRALLGDPAPLRLPLERAMAPLLDVARVALRERGHRLDWRSTPAAAGVAVDAGVVVERAAQTLCLLVEVVPEGTTGTFVFEGAATAPATVLRLCFEPASGSLPFPLPVGEVRERLQRATALAPNAPSCRQLGSGIELTFSRAATSAAQEA